MYIMYVCSVALTSSIFARRYDVPGRYSPFVKWERFERHRFSGGDHRQKWSLERYSPPVKACSLVFAVITGALERSNYGFLYILESEYYFRSKTTDATSMCEIRITNLVVITFRRWRYFNHHEPINMGS